MRVSSRGLVALVGLVAATAAAQTPQSNPSRERHQLPTVVDTNDWEPYYDIGVQQLTRNRFTAEAAFHWAARLDPTRAEPLFARWVAFYANDPQLFYKSLTGDKDVLRDPRIQDVNAMRARAIQRNPFVHQGLMIVAYSNVFRFGDDALTKGWFHYARGELPQALERLGKAVDRDPVGNANVRFIRANAFVNTRQVDSALFELQKMLAHLRSLDTGKRVATYESKELVEFAIGLIHADRRNVGAAVEAFGRAVAENAGYAPAHLALGRIAIARNEQEKGLAELSLAVSLDSTDVAAKLEYANALYYARRQGEALEHVQAAIALEPWYAEGYLRLATIYDSMDDVPRARQAYTDFLARAPKKSAAGIRKAEQRLRELPKP